MKKKFGHMGHASRVPGTGYEAADTMGRTARSVLRRIHDQRKAGLEIMKAFRSCASLFVLFWLLAPAHVLAADQSPPIEHKPFATRHVVLQISDDSPRKQAAVLNVASNLIKYYGPDKLDVEVVAFGHGLPLLLAGNANAERIHSLALSGGVKFDACENTLQTMARKLGHVPKLVPDAKPVPSGAARIVELVHDGYILIRP